MSREESEPEGCVCGSTLPHSQVVLQPEAIASAALLGYPSGSVYTARDKRPQIVGERGQGEEEGEREADKAPLCGGAWESRTFPPIKICQKNGWGVTGSHFGLPLVCSGAVWSLVAGVWHASVDLWSPVLPLGCTCSEQQDKVVMRYKVWWNCMGKHPQNFPAESEVVTGDCWAMQDWNSWNSSQPVLLTYPNHQGNNTLEPNWGHWELLFLISTGNSPH